MSICINIEFLRSQKAPLYPRGNSEAELETAFIEIDENGSITASWNVLACTSTPMTRHFGQTLRIPVHNATVGDDLADFLETDGVELLERIHNGHSKEWEDGGFSSYITDDAEDALQELVEALEELPQETIVTADEWMKNDPLNLVWPEGESLAGAADHAMGLRGDEIILGDMKQALLTKARLSYQYPSSAATAGRWDIARALAEDSWDPSDTWRFADAVEQACGYADAIDAATADSWDDLVGLDPAEHHNRRRGSLEVDIESSLQAMLDGSPDIWFPEPVRKELLSRRVSALKKEIRASIAPDDLL